MPFHTDLTDVDVHVVTRWTVTDAAARNALVVTSTDVDKVVRQTDNDSYWVLLSSNPAVWKEFTSTAPASALVTRENGNLLSSSTQSYDFIGTGVSTSAVGDAITVNISGGVGSGDVTAAANIADNEIVRGDGGAKGIQGTPTGNATLSDTGDLVVAGGITAGGDGTFVNIKLPSASASVISPVQNVVAAGASLTVTAGDSSTGLVGGVLALRGGDAQAGPGATVGGDLTIRAGNAALTNGTGGDLTLEAGTGSTAGNIRIGLNTGAVFIGTGGVGVGNTILGSDETTVSSGVINLGSGIPSSIIKPVIRPNEGNIVTLAGGDTSGVVAGGDLNLQGGVSASGTDGIVSIGQIDTSSIEIATVGIPTNIAGNLSVAGDIIVTGTVDGVALAAFKSAYDSHAHPAADVDAAGVTDAWVLTANSGISVWAAPPSGADKPGIGEFEYSGVVALTTNPTSGKWTRDDASDALVTRIDISSTALDGLGVSDIFATLTVGSHLYLRFNGESQTYVVGVGGAIDRGIYYDIAVSHVSNSTSWPGLTVTDKHSLLPVPAANASAPEGTDIKSSGPVTPAWVLSADGFGGASWQPAGSPAAHLLGGSSHQADSLGNLNLLINGGNLDFDTEPRPPIVHPHNVAVGLTPGPEADGFMSGGDKTKVDYLIVSATTDLDTMRADVATNKLHTENIDHTGDVVTVGATAIIQPGVVDNTMLAPMAQNTIKGNDLVLGDPVDLTGVEVRTISATHTDHLGGDVTGTEVLTIGADKVITPNILDNNVTLPKLAPIATGSILGRATAAVGNVEVLDSVTAVSVLGLDPDLQTFSVQPNTSITTFGATFVGNIDAPSARTTLGVDAAGVDNSTNVTVVGPGTYLTLVGQEITQGLIVPTADLSATGIKDQTTFLRGDNTWQVPLTGVTSLDALTDTDLVGVADTNVLAYDLATTSWKPAAAGAGTVTGPGVSVIDNIATYTDTTGKTIKDSGIAVGAVALNTTHSEITAGNPHGVSLGTMLPGSLPELNLIVTDATLAGVGVAVGKVPQLIDVAGSPGLPAVNGSLLTGVATTLDALTDTDLVGVADTNVLAYDLATTSWKPAAAGAGTVTSVVAQNGLQETGTASVPIVEPVYGTTANTLIHGDDGRLGDDRTASGVRTATTTVSSSASAAPVTGNVLRASSGILASWTSLNWGDLAPDTLANFNSAVSDPNLAVTGVFIKATDPFTDGDVVQDGDVWIGI